MTWDLHHTESERLAREAQAAHAARDGEAARELYRRAAEAEERALAAVDPAKSRTRGITAVSALSLWLKSGQHEKATARGEELLEDKSLPRFATVQIREIVEAARTGRGAQHPFEVEITFRQTLRYAVSARDRTAAERQAVTLWQGGNGDDVLASDACELLEVHAHATSGEDRR